MIIIAGAGLAGMSAAMFLKKDYKVFEKESEPGGLVRTVKQDGFSFDYAGHWFHARHDWVKEFMQKNLGQNWKWHRRDARIWSHDVITDYPFQINLGGLPQEVIVECLMGMIEAKHTNWKGRIGNFEDFILRSMGKGVAKHFMTPYNQKLWKTHPREMTTDWMGRFVPQPQIETALRSALNPHASAEAGYNAGFHYPSRGGAGSITKALAQHVDSIECSTEIRKVYAKKRKVELSDGRVLDYSALVSTIPLHRLANITVDAPSSVKNAARKLKWRAIYALHLGVTDIQLPIHWLYVPEKSPSFFRIGCYSNVCKSMAPKNMASLYIEYSYRSRVPKTNDTMTGKYALHWLKQMGVVGPKSKLITEMAIPMNYAYVLYDHNRNKATQTLQDYFRRNNIHSIGRYGSWEYSSMEDAMNQGKETAEKLNAL